MSTKVNRIELDKTKGLVIQVVNGEQTQTITLDGESITMEVKGLTGVSTIVQKPDSVTVTCDKFVFEGKTFECTASQSATLTSTPTSLSLSPSAASLSSPTTKVIGEGTASVLAPDINLAGEAVTVSAPAGVIALTGLNVNILGETGTEMEAPLMSFIGVPAFL
jgi:hypothetical protein